MRIFKSFSDGLSAMADSLRPMEAPSFGSFSQDRAALLGDFNRVASDIGTAVRRVVEDNQAKRRKGGKQGFKD